MGIPAIINYAKEQYHAGNQVWDITQDDNGIVYFANNDGLLAFDGSTWRTYRLPNKVIARSLCIGPDKRIYVGGQQEIGFFSPGTNGDLSYTSLNHLIPSGQDDFADVWSVCAAGGNIFFRSNKKVFIYDGKTIRSFSSTNWQYLNLVDKRVIAYNYDVGFVQYHKGRWLPMVQQGNLPLFTRVKSVLSMGGDSLMIATLADGMYVLQQRTLTPFISKDLASIGEQNIINVISIGNNRLAVITSLGGCIITDKQGNFIQRITRKDGLQNNNILSILLDRNKNIWLGEDNGIDLLLYNNHIKNIYPDEDRNPGYTSTVYKGKLYMGIATGLYQAALGSEPDVSMGKGRFVSIPEVKGQVWNLSVVNDKLIAGKYQGAYVIEGEHAILLDDKTGFWTFRPLYKTTPSPVMIAGTYNGINVYDYNGKGFTNPKMHAQFESARFVAVQENVIWIAHPYKGIYKVIIDGQRVPRLAAHINTRPLLSANNNYIFQLRDKIILSNEKGIFELDKQRETFFRSPYFTKIFGNKAISFLKEDRYGNIWFSHDKQVGVIDVTSGKEHLIYIPEIANRITAGGYENIYVADSNNVLIGAEKGFFHVNYAAYKHSVLPFSVSLRAVRSINRKDSLLFGGYANGATPEKTVAYGLNSLRFEFSSSLYGQAQTVEYSYFLKGLDKEWSSWDRAASKTFAALPAGHYVFMVRCRNSGLATSAVVSYAFNILPPWYQTGWAYLLFGCLVSAALYFFYKRQQSKYKKIQLRKLKEQEAAYIKEQNDLALAHRLKVEQNEMEIVKLTNEKLQAEIEQKKLEEVQERMLFMHRLEVEQNENEIIKLTNEKLQAELAKKNVELASSAMAIVQKSELLGKIKDDLTRLKNNAEIEKDSKDFKKILRVIDTELNSPQDWEQFATHFDSVHDNYLQLLKEKFPDLTASELKLCAFLRLNLNTKEIAQLMNISVRGVETSRYRLRKKLSLSNEANLFDYLIGLANTN